MQGMKLVLKVRCSWYEILQDILLSTEIAELSAENLPKLVKFIQMEDEIASMGSNWSQRSKAMTATMAQISLNKKTLFVT